MRLQDHLASHTSDSSSDEEEDNNKHVAEKVKPVELNLDVQAKPQRQVADIQLLLPSAEVKCRPKAGAAVLVLSSSESSSSEESDEEEVGEAVPEPQLKPKTKAAMVSKRKSSLEPGFSKKPKML